MRLRVCVDPSDSRRLLVERQETPEEAAASSEQYDGVALIHVARTTTESLEGGTKDKRALHYRVRVEDDCRVVAKRRDGDHFSAEADTDLIERLAEAIRQASDRYEVTVGDPALTNGHP